MVLLAVVDAAFAGFRAAAGRDARIDKRAYYRRAVIRGGAAGAGLCVALAAMTAGALLASGDAGVLWADLLAIGARMLEVLLGYTVLVLTALALYATTRLELRILATVTILGPFTLLRPAVIAAATAWGVAAGRSGLAVGLTVASSAAVLLLGKLLDGYYGRVARVRITP
jgi:hypothetical protein